MGKRESEHEFRSTLFTRFYDDFSIAERFGEAEIRGLYQSKVLSTTNNHKVVVELLNVLRFKIRESRSKQPDFVPLYVEL